MTFVRSKLDYKYFPGCLVYILAKAVLIFLLFGTPT